VSCRSFALDRLRPRLGAVAPGVWAVTPGPGADGPGLGRVGLRSGALPPPPWAAAPHAWGDRPRAGGIAQGPGRSGPRPGRTAKRRGRNQLGRRRKGRSRTSAQRMPGWKARRGPRKRRSRWCFRRSHGPAGGGQRSLKLKGPSSLTTGLPGPDGSPGAGCGRLWGRQICKRKGRCHEENAKAAEPAS
jgi:hypothetical protein